MFPLWDMATDPDKISEETFFETNAFKMRSRFSKTLYCGEVDEDEISDDDYDDDEDITPPLPLTDIAVEYFQDVAPRKFGCVDRIFASSVASRARASPCSVMMSMIYAKRLRQKNPAYLDHMSSSDLFLISMMMASKFIYDDGIEEEVFNDEWAEAADIELSEINTLEQQFLQAIDWQLFVKREEFFHLVNKLEQRIALQQAIDRGWFSYTDLSVLMRNPDYNFLWTKIGTCWLQVVLISSTAYLAGVMVVIASTITALQVSSTLTIVGTVLLSQSSVTQLQPVTGPVLPQPSVTELPSLDVASNISHFNNLVANSHVDSLRQPTSNPTESVTSTPSRDAGSTISHFDQHSLHQPTSNDYSLLATLLQKLFAVITLKENLVKFVCAVSDNYRSTTTQGRELSNNLSTSVEKPSCLVENSAAVLSTNHVCSNCKLKQSKTSTGNPAGPRFTSASLQANSRLTSASLSQPANSDPGHSIRSHSGHHLSCCCEEPPGFKPGLVDTGLSFTTRSYLPISVGA